MSLDAATGMDAGNRSDLGDVANYKATASESAPNPVSFTNISAADAFEVTVSSTRFLTDANYRMEGDDLVISGANGEGYRLLGWMSAELQPGLIAEDGGVLEPDVIATLANNGSEQGVATAQMGGSGLAVQVGTVDNISGEVFAARSGGELIALKAGDPVYQDDEIVTGVDGVVGFVFADESTFSIGEDARMIIDEFVYDPETASGSIDMNILKGAFTFASGLIADANPTNMVMTTPQAVIGIRGTAGGGFVNPDGESEFFNTEGAISITTDAGVAIIDRPLETTRVQNRNEPPSEPELSNAQNLASKFSKVLEASPSASASTELILEAGETLNLNDETRDEETRDEESEEEEDAAQSAEEPTEEDVEDVKKEAKKEAIEESEDAGLENSVNLDQSYLIEALDTVQELETKEISSANLVRDTSVNTDLTSTTTVQTGVTDTAGNVSNVATSAVRVKDELSIDVDLRGTQNFAPLVLQAGTFVSDRSTYIVGPNVKVTGVADNITLSVNPQDYGSHYDNSQNVLDPPLEGYFIAHNLMVAVNPSSQEGEALTVSLTSIGHVPVNVALPDTGEIIISAENGGPLSGDQIELILSHIRYQPEIYKPESNTTATVEIKLSTDVTEVSSQSKIEIINENQSDDFKISGTVDEVFPQYGRVVSGTDAGSGVAIAKSTEIHDSYVSTRNEVPCTLALHGFRDGDQLYLSKSGYVFYEHGSGVPADVTNNDGIDSGNGVLPLDVGNGLVFVSYEEATQTLSFKFKDETGTDTTYPDEVETLLNKIHLKTSDGEGGRAIEIGIELEDGNNNFQYIKSVFEVSPLPTPAPVEFDADGSGEQVLELDELEDGVQYIGNSGNEDELRFNALTGSENRVIDLSTIDKITGKIDGFEIIGLNNNTFETLRLNGEVVAALSDKIDTASGKTVLQVTADIGDSGGIRDSVDLGGEFSVSETSDGYTAYESENAIVYISEGVTVIGLQSS